MDYIEDDKPPYLELNLDDLRELHNDYRNTEYLLHSELPLMVNWDSRLEVISYLNQELNCKLTSLKIKELEEEKSRKIFIEQGLDHLIEINAHTEEEIDVLSCFVEYLKVRYFRSNYISCIFRHEKDGKILLRYIDNQLCMPNKRPMFYQEDLIDCVVSFSEGDYREWLKKEMTTMKKK